MTDYPVQEGFMRPNLADIQSVHPKAWEIINSDIGVVSKIFEDKFSTVWKRMFTKSIQAPGSYYSSKTLATGLTAAICESAASRALDSNLAFIAGILEEYDFPTYYVAAELFEALKRSNPPEAITWADMQLPFPAISFMLPRGALKEPEEAGGHDIMLIGIAKLVGGRAYRIPTLGPVQALPDDRMSVFWLVGPSAIVSNNCTFPATMKLKPNEDWITVNSKGNYVGPEAKFSAHVTGLIANLILVMEARKELVEAGEWSKRELNGQPKKTVRKPTFIGRNYAILRRKSDEPAKHRFTELDWRAGHFRRQHYGPKSEAVKTIWIDPYIAFTRGLAEKAS